MKSVKECNLMVEVYFKAKSYNVIKIDSIGEYLPFRQKLYYLENGFQKEETEMKVMALTNGFMRKKGEWYVVRDSLTNCYIIETGKTLTCVLKTDFITQEEHERRLAVKRVVNIVYSGYRDTDSISICKGNRGNSYNVPLMVDLNKVKKLSDRDKELLYSIIEEVKA